MIMLIIINYYSCETFKASSASLRKRYMDKDLCMFGLKNLEIHKYQI